MNQTAAIPEDPARAQLLRRGSILEWITSGWDVVGIVVLAITALAARFRRPGRIRLRLAD